MIKLLLAFLFNVYLVLGEAQQNEDLNHKVHDALIVLSDHRSSLDIKDEALQQLRNAGDKESQYALNTLADIYHYGLYGQRQNVSHSFQLYNHTAIVHGNSSSYFRAGLYYSFGFDGAVNQNQGKALLMYTMASLGNDVHANIALGDRYLHGVGVKKDCDQSLKHYKSAAKVVAEKYKQSYFGINKQSRMPVRLPDENGGLYGIGSRASNTEVSSHSSGASTVSAQDIIQFFRYNAEKGDVHSQLTLGSLYYFGTPSLQRNFEFALRYLRSAASKLPEEHIVDPDVDVRSSAQAAALLGQMYIRGEGVKQDNNVALKWFKRAANQNNAAAYNCLGLMYQNGIVVPADSDRAFQFFVKAAEKENSDAQTNLGLMLMDKKRRDYSAAFKYFSAAAKQGHIMAIYQLGRMHGNGLSLTPSCHIAVTHFKHVVEKGDYEITHIQQAYRHYQNQEYHLAAMEYMIAAELGIDAAQINLAWLLDSGKVKLLSDQFSDRLALQMWHRASNQGYVDARVRVGDYFYYGKGTDVDYATSASFYRAAEQDLSAIASYNLGYMHENGLGVEKDYHLAKRYFDRALKVNPDAYLPVMLSLIKLNVKNMVHWLFYGGTLFLDAPALETPQKPLHKDYHLLQDLERHETESSAAEYGGDSAGTGDSAQSHAHSNGVDGRDTGGEYEDITSYFDPSNDESEYMLMLILFIMAGVLLWARQQPAGAAGNNVNQQVWDNVRQNMNVPAPDLVNQQTNDQRRDNQTPHNPTTATTSAQQQQDDQPTYSSEGASTSSTTNFLQEAESLRQRRQSGNDFATGSSS
ncbi:hypothetical protein MIR68_008937 [Amoeboaphelidium protococcarum]|nr:hypothetical protein MIR68_008937 [Amoeboaphelidium protococcarum]